MSSRHLTMHFSYLDHLMRTVSGKFSYYVMVNNFYTLFLTSFEIPLIFRLTNSVKFLVLYYLVYYTAMGITLLFTPRIFYKFTLSAIFKVQILIYVLMTSLLIMFYSYLDNVYLLLIFGCIHGAVGGIYWFAYHYSMLGIVKEDKRDYLLLTLHSINVLFPVIVPVFGGLIISLLSFDVLPKNEHLPNGYILIFMTALFFSILAYLNAPEITKKIETKVHYRKLFKMAHGKSLINLQHYLLFDTAQGTLVALAISLLNFLILKKEANLGLFNSALAFLASYYFIFLRRLNEQKKVNHVRMYFTGIIGEIISRLMYFMMANIYGLLIKATISSLIFPLKGIFSDTIIMHHLHAKSAEHKYSKIYIVLVKEYYLLVSRLVAFSLLLLVLTAFEPNPVGFAKAILLFGGAIGIIDYLLIKRVAHE